MEMTGTFFFDPEDLIYNDHFPGNPIVPGTQIIRAFREAAQRAVPGSNCFVIDNFKFRQFIIPGEYAYRIQYKENFLSCELFDKNLAVATGKLIIS
jgi:3-hydroxyacyl-[acyl-carrier-protein] dehydratase